MKVVNESSRYLEEKIKIKMLTFRRVRFPFQAIDVGSNQSLFLIVK